MLLYYRKCIPNVALYLNLKSGQGVGRQLYQRLYKEGRFPSLVTVTLSTPSVPDFLSHVSISRGAVG